MDSVIKYKGREVQFLNLDPLDHIESYLARGEWYEDRVLKFIEGLHVEGNYVDAGAYVGNHSIFFALFCPVKTVYSFEPQIGAYTDLLRNVIANGAGRKCIPQLCALSDHAGSGTFENVTPGNRGMATLQPLLNPMPVGIVTLDSLTLDIILMKVDVEGMELNVLRGAEKTLANIRHLFVEMAPMGFNNLEITHLLMNNDFEEREHFEEEQLYYFKKVR